MGFEYRLRVDPPLTDLALVCDEIFATTDWRRVPTSLLEVPDGIGVQRGDTPAAASWPQDVDLHLESEQVIFVVSHLSGDRQFMDALIAHLESNGHSVTIDDDI